MARLVKAVEVHAETTNPAWIGPLVGPRGNMRIPIVTDYVASRSSADCCNC